MQKFISDMGKILSLNQKERDIYKLLLEHGPLDLSMLRDLSSTMDGKEITKFLNTLQSEDLVLSVGKKVKRYQALPPFSVISRSYKNLNSKTFNISNKIEEEKEKVKSELIRSLNRYQKQCNARIDEVKENIGSNVEILIDAANESKNLLLENASNGSELVKKIEETKKDSQESLLNVRKNTNARINEGIQTVGTELETSLKEIKQEINDLKRAPRNISDELTSIRTDLEENLAQMEQNVDNKLDHLTEEASSEEELEKIQELDSTFTTSLETFQQSIKETMESLQNDLKDSFSSPISILEEAYQRNIEQLKNKITHRQEEIDSSITESLQEHQLKSSEELRTIHSNFREEVESIFSSLEDGQANIQRLIIDHLEETLTSLQREIQEILKSHNESLTKVQSIVSKKTTESISQIDTNVEHTKNTLNNQTTALLQDFSQLQKEIVSMVSDTVTSEINNAVQAKMDISTSLMETISNATNQFTQEMKNIAKLEETPMEDLTITPLDDMKENISQILTKYQKEYVSLYKDLESKHRGKIKETINNIESQYTGANLTSLAEEGIHLLENIDEGSKEENIEDVKEILSQIKSNAKEMHSSFETLRANIVDEITTDKDTNLSQLEKVTGAIEKEVNDFFQERKKEAKTRFREHREEIGRTLEEGYENMHNSMRRVVDQSREKLTTIIEDLKTNLNQMKSGIRKEVGEKIGENQELIRKEKNKVFQDLSSLYNTVDTQLTEIDSRIENMRKNQTETSKELLNNAIQNLTKEKDEIKASIETTLQKWKSIEQKSKESLLEANQRTKNVSTENIEETIQKAEDLLSQSSELVKNSIEEEESNLREKLEEEMLSIEENVEQMASKTTREIERESNQVTSDLDTTLSRKISELQQYIARIQERFSETVSSMGEATTSTLNTTHTSLSNGIENINSALNEEIKQISVSTNNTIETIKSDLLTTLKDILQDIQLSNNEKLKNSEEDLQKSLKTVQTSLNSILSDIESQVTKYEELKKKYTQQVPTRFNSLLESMRNKTEENLTEIRGKVENDLQNSYQVLKKDLTKFLDTLKNLEASATQIKEDIMNIEKQKNSEIWQIYGKECLLSKLQSMISEASTSITLRAAEIPQEIINALNESKGAVEIIVSEETDVGSLEKKAWVQVTDKDIHGIIANRDDVETLIIPETRDDKWSGVVFISERISFEF